MIICVFLASEKTLMSFTKSKQSLLIQDNIELKLRRFDVNHFEDQLDNIGEFDVVVLDANIDRDAIFYCIKTVRGKSTNAKIIVSCQPRAITPFLYNELIKRKVEAIILQDQDTNKLKELIRVVYHGGSHYDPSLVNDFLTSNFVEVSQRELLVLRLICKGMYLKEIAHELNVSIRTVSNNRKRLYDKFNVQNDIALTIEAIRLGYLSSQEIIDSTEY